MGMMKDIGSVPESHQSGRRASYEVVFGAGIKWCPLFERAFSPGLVQ